MSRTSTGLVVVGLLAGCAAVRPPPRTLEGPAPRTAQELEAARWLDLVRAELGDLLLIPPAPDRPTRLPDPGRVGRAEALLRLERRRSEVERWSQVELSPAFRSELLHAEVLLRRAEMVWGDGEHLRPIRLEEAFVRARAAFAAGAPDPEGLAVALADLLEAAADGLRIAHDRERVWGLARADEHARATLDRIRASAARDRLSEAWSRYRAALAAAAPAPAARELGSSLALALGATRAPDLTALETAAAKIFADDRRRLYQLSLEVAPDGPARVEARILEALSRARSEDATPADATLTRAIQKLSTELGARSIPVRLRPADGTILAVGSSTVAVPLEEERLRELGPNAVLASVAHAVAAAVVLARSPPNRVFPPDPVSTEALSTRWLTALAETEGSTLASGARLLIASVVAERHARAWAELTDLHDGRGRARELLIEDAWHDAAAAEEVLSATEIHPGIYAAPFAAEQMLANRRGCAGLPAAPCILWHQEAVE